MRALRQPGGLLLCLSLPFVDKRGCGKSDTVKEEREYRENKVVKQALAKKHEHRKPEHGLHQRRTAEEYSRRVKSIVQVSEKSDEPHRA